MARRTIKRRKNRRSSRKQRGGLGGSLFSTFTSALLGSQQQKQQAPQAQITADTLKTLFLTDVKPVVLTYINAAGSFCIIPSMASRAYSFMARKAATEPTFKTPEQIFDGFLEFLYKNRFKYIQLVTKLQKILNIDIPIDKEAVGAMSLSSYIPGAQRGIILTIKTFIDPNALKALYDAINSVLVNESAAAVCSSSDKKPEFAKKLLIAVAGAIITNDALRTAVVSAL
jgi:hypothetical protein